MARKKPLSWKKLSSVFLRKNQNQSVVLLLMNKPGDTDLLYACDRRDRLVLRTERYLAWRIFVATLSGTVSVRLASELPPRQKITFALAMNAG
jgi:hypothetical protein